MLIGKNYKIESDPLNVILYRRHRVQATDKKPAHDIWSIEGYFSKIKQAFDFLVEHEVKLTDMKDFETVAKKQEELHNLIKSLNMEG